MRVSYRWGVAVVCAVALAATGTSVAPAAESRIPLAGTAYNPVDGYTDTGPAAAGVTVSNNIYLGVRDPGALADQAKSVSTLGGPHYGKYVTSGRNQADHQLDPAQIARIQD